MRTKVTIVGEPMIPAIAKSVNCEDTMRIS
jgi:hypothetical protein